MKIKSIIFAALVAGMSMSANAQTAYTDAGDKLTAENITLKSGATTVINLYLTRKTAPDFTNIQFNISYPEGIRPYMDPDMEDYGWEGDDVMGKRASNVNYTTNFGKESAYPNFSVVGVNMNKVAITANPAQLYCISISADENMETGDYDITTDYIKYTCYSNDSYATAGKQVVCTVHVEGTATGINDLNVEKAANGKFIKDGQVVIMHNGRLYNVMGQNIK